MLETPNTQPGEPVVQPIQTPAPAVDPNEQLAIQAGLMPGGEGWNEFVENAPIIEQPGPQQEQAQPQQTGGEPPPDEYLVQSTVQPDPNNPNPAPAEIAPLEVAPGAKVKIGEVELSHDQILEGRKYFDNHEKWQKTFNTKSQIINNFSDDQLPHVIPYASKQKKLPDNLAELALKQEDLPKTFEYKDGDGDIHQVPLDLIPKETLEAMTRNMFAASYPEFEKQGISSAEMQTKFDELNEAHQNSSVHFATKVSIDFMREHPELAISVKKSQNFGEIFQSILEDPTHPEHEAAYRFKAVVDRMETYGGDLNSNYAILYGQQNRDQKITDKIKENKANDVPPIKGKEIIMSDDDKEVAAMSNPEATMISNLFGPKAGTVATG